MKNARLELSLYATAVVLLLCIASTAFADTYPQLVSIPSDGGPTIYPPVRATGSWSPAISANGEFVSFTSSATNLVSDDTNNQFDVFVHNELTGTTERINIASDGSQANGSSARASVISAEGRYVVFISSASNLVPNDTNDVQDIFVHDRVTGATERVSISSDGTQANDWSGYNEKNAITPDGRYVAFTSPASNLVPNDTNGFYDVFVHDRVTGSTERVSVASDGTQADTDVFGPSISDNGRYITFVSRASNLADGGSNGNFSVFVHDLVTGSTERVNAATNQLNISFDAESISADGRYVAMINTISGINYFVVYDRLINTTIFTSESPVNIGTMSADGRYVIYGYGSLYIRDLASGLERRVDAASDGTAGNGASNCPAISQDDRYIVFCSIASNLVPNDLNGKPDIFITDNPLTRNNSTPVLDVIGDKVVNEGQLLQFTLSATDPDGNALTYSAVNLPTGATFDSQTATFTWTPTYAQAGNYPNVEFTVTDNGSPMELDVELITITVGNVNRAPVVEAAGTQEVLEGTPLSFTVTASDPDGDSTTLGAQNLPTGATFDSGTGAFAWTPTLAQSGVYVVAFSATDNDSVPLTGIADVTITVGDDPTPVEQAQNIVDIVVNYNLPAGVENSYLSNLKKVQKFIEDGKVNQAINQINAFINKVNQDYSHGDITQAEHDNLIALANALLADLQ